MKWRPKVLGLMALVLVAGFAVYQWGIYIKLSKNSVAV